MNHPLSFKIRQMHAALTGIRSYDLGQIEVKRGQKGDEFYTEIDFTGGATEVELANIVTLLIANVGSLRDHFKNWCEDHSVPFEGDKLINSNMACAIVHDLWNTDKHGKLTRPPRSGHHVQLTELHKGLCLSTGMTAGSTTVFRFDPITGNFQTQSSGGGTTSVIVSGLVLDGQGNRLGDLSQFIEQAVDAWETCLRQAGVSF